MHSPNKFKVQQLRTKNLVLMVETIAVIVAVLFVSAILPSILIRYVYAGQQLLEQPKLLEYIPVVGFVVGVGYFLLTLWGNMVREKQAQKLEDEMIDGDCDCGGRHSHHNGNMLKELDSLSKKAVTKKTSRRKVTKK